MTGDFLWSQFSSVCSLLYCYLSYNLEKISIFLRFLAYRLVLRYKEYKEKEFNQSQQNTVVLDQKRLYSYKTYIIQGEFPRKLRNKGRGGLRGILAPCKAQFCKCFFYSRELSQQSGVKEMFIYNRIRLCSQGRQGGVGIKGK